MKIAAATGFVLLGLLGATAVAHAEGPPIVAERAKNKLYLDCFKGLVASADGKRNYSMPPVGPINVGSSKLWPVEGDGNDVFFFDSDGASRSVTVPAHDTANAISELLATSFKVTFAGEKPVYLDFLNLPDASHSDETTLYPDRLVVTQTDEPDTKVKELAWKVASVEAERKALKGEVIDRIKKVRATYEANLVKEPDEYLDVDKANYLKALAGCDALDDVDVKRALDAERDKFDVTDVNAVVKPKMPREKKGAVEGDPSAVKTDETKSGPAKPKSSGEGTGKVPLGK